MKTHPYSHPLRVLAASAAFALCAPLVVHAQQPTSSPSGSDTDVFDVIKKGADRLQKQAKEAKELSPKVKLLEERQNELHKKVQELEVKLGRQQEIIDHLHKEMEKLEAQANKPVPPPPITAPIPPAPTGTVPPAPPNVDASKPVPPLPPTEPPTRPSPAATP